MHKASFNVFESSSSFSNNQDYKVGLKSSSLAKHAEYTGAAYHGASILLLNTSLTFGDILAVEM
jgi:hypothetical protein